MHSTSVMRLFASILVVACIGIYFAGCKKDSSPTGPSGGAGSVVNVTGKVITYNGQPASGIPVLIPGKVSVNTDANGAFTIANVTVPYDIIMVIGSLKQAYICRAISRSDPTLVFIGATSGIPDTATIAGKIYPASAFPQAATRKTMFAFVSPEVVGVTGPDGAVSPAPYTLGLSWFGSGSITGTIHALQWDVDASSLPTTYQRYGSRSGVAVTNGGTFANVNDTMGTTPATVNLSGTVSVASGYSIIGNMIYAQFGGRSAFALGVQLSPATTFSYKTPDISGLTIELYATARKGAVSGSAFKGGIAPNSSSTALVIPPGPELSLPINSATGVRTGAPFSWNAFPGGIQIITFNGPAGQPDIFIMTMAASDSLPNLTSVGLPIPASTAYEWQVLGLGPFTSMDAATGPTGFLPAGMSMGRFEGAGTMGESDTRTFTTAP